MRFVKSPAARDQSAPNAGAMALSAIRLGRIMDAVQPAISKERRLDLVNKFSILDKEQRDAAGLLDDDCIISHLDRMGGACRRSATDAPTCSALFSSSLESSALPQLR